jgi:hypothetical protein
MNAIKKISSFFLLLVIFVSCIKDDENILSILSDIKKQNAELQDKVETLQRTTDSLSALIKVTNKQTSLLDKKIDSVQKQIVFLLSQITVLNAQMNDVSIDIRDVKSKLSELQAKCAELIELLKQLTGQVSLSNGLLAYYPFAGNAFDSSGNGYNGSISGAELIADRFGRLNSAFHFKENQQIVIPKSATLNTYPISISLWYAVDSLYPGIAGNIFSKYEPASWNGFQILLGDFRSVPNNNVVENNGFGVTPWYVRSISNRIIGYYGERPFLQQNIAAKNWYHYVFTVDSSGAKIYVNGRLVDSDAWTGQAGACSSGFLWKIGGAYAGSWFKGSIDDIRVYNRVISQDEVLRLYNF